MSLLPLVLKGFLVGIAIAAPVGPIGILCIRRTLAEGRFIGFVSGLGAATADMSYGAIAAFGLTAIQETLAARQNWLHILGGAFLLYLGTRTLLSVPAQRNAPDAPHRGWLTAYLSTFALTLTNPATILSFALVFAGFGLSIVGGSYAAASLVVLGVFLGSTAWWLTLSSVVGALRGRFTPRWMLWVNRTAGAIILAFGALALFSG